MQIVEIRDSETVFEKVLFTNSITGLETHSPQSQRILIEILSNISKIK